MAYKKSGYNRHMQKRRLSLLLISSLLFLGTILWACDPVQEPPATEQAPTIELPTVVVSTNTPEVLATATEVPPPITVNGESIPLSYYQNEISRHLDSLAGQTVLPTEQEVNQTVLDYLVDQQLLSQAARQKGFQVSDQQLQERIDQLVIDLGSGGALTDWMQTNHYDDTEFRLALRLSMEAAWQRDQIAQTVPDSVEQVRAQQIFAATQAGADRALNSLNAGANFATLAWDYSPESGGELGWFPRGYLLYPEVEDAAFSLEPGTYSGVIQSEIGFHILLVLEHEAEHPLTTDARLSLQNKALIDWLAQAHSSAQIVNNLP